MAILNLDLFLGVPNDVESAQYRILAAIHESRMALGRTEVYPTLSNAIEVYTALSAVLENGKSLRDAQPKKLTGLDLKEGTLQFEPLYPELDRPVFNEELIIWSLPYLKSTIDEGTAIYEFVAEKLHVQQVGIVPLYRDEGYLIIPDFRGITLHILRYSTSVITDAGERYRSIRTSYVRRESIGVMPPSPADIKLQLVNEYQNLPNPSTFYVEPEVDFPFEPTTFPVARRMLMQMLASENGSV